MPYRYADNLEQRPNFIPPRQGEAVENSLADREKFDRWAAGQDPDFPNPKRYEASRKMREENPDLFNRWTWIHDDGSDQISGIR